MLETIFPAESKEYYVLIIFFLTVRNLKKENQKKKNQHRPLRESADFVNLVILS